MGKKQSKQSNSTGSVLPPSKCPDHIQIPISLDDNSSRFSFLGNHTFLIPTVHLDDVLRRLEYTSEWIPIEFVVNNSNATNRIVVFGHSESLVVIVTDDFKVFCAGKSSELNNFGNNATWRDFKKIKNTFTEIIKSVYCIKESALFITADGQVYAYSNSKMAKLGLSEGSATMEPVKIETVDIFEKGLAEEVAMPKIKSISFSENLTAFLSEEGKVYVCGYGSGDKWKFPIKDEDETPFKRLDTPALIKSLLKNKVIKQVACGLHHMLFLTDNGELYVCGNNELGQLGNGKNESVDGCVKRVKFGIGVKHIAASNNFSVIVTEDNQIYRCGDLSWQVKNKPTSFNLPTLLTEYTEIGNPPVKSVHAVQSGVIIQTESDEIYMIGPLEAKLGFEAFRKLSILKGDGAISLSCTNNSIVCNFDANKKYKF